MPVTLSLIAVECSPDLPAIRTCLTAHGLSADNGPFLVGEGWEGLAFETSWIGTGARSFYGEIYNTAANTEVCELVFDLASSGRLVVTVAPGPPHLIVCGHTHLPADVQDESIPPGVEEVCFVDSPAQLYEALHGGWEKYRSGFADRYWL